MIDDPDMEMVNTGIIIPDVPEMADDDTEQARDELIQLDKDLSECQTFTNWIKQEIFTPCDALRVAHEKQLNEEKPKLGVSETE